MMIVVVVWKERIHAFHADDAVVSWDNMRTLYHAGAYFKHIQREERKMEREREENWNRKFSFFILNCLGLFLRFVINCSSLFKIPETFAKVLEVYHSNVI